MNQKPYHFSLFLEILMPYVPIPLRQPLLLFSKLSECMECMNPRNSYFSQIPYQNTGSFSEQLPDILARLSPFLSEAERNSISQMQNMMQMLQMYQMMQAMSAMSSPDAEADCSDHSNRQTEGSQATTDNSSGDMPDFSSPDPDALLSMLSPEQQQTFEMLKNMMNQNN